MAGEDLVLGAFGLIWILFIMLWIFVFALAIASFVFWIFMLIDVTKREFPKKDDKTIWILIVVLAGVIGAIVYYFLIKKKNIGQIKN